MSKPQTQNNNYMSTHALKMSSPVEEVVAAVDEENRDPNKNTADLTEFL